jgi:multiple antibiotic resistance protein
MLENIIRDALMIWVTVDPISTLALFAAITHGMSARERRTTAIKSCVYSAILLLIAIVLGQIILTAMNIKLVSLQVSGGIILFLFSLQMLFGQTSASASSPEEGPDIAVFPLAVPSIAGPDTIMAVIILTDNHLYPIEMQAITAGIMLIILAITCILMLLAGPVLRVIGRNGAALLERIMGMILSALSIELVMNALGVSHWATFP